MRDQKLKTDAGKLRLELIPTSQNTSTAKVLMHGLTKYDEDSWKNVEISRYIGSIKRHLDAFIDDPLGVDEESGLLHSEHVLCNAMFINHLTVEQSKKSIFVDGLEEECCSEDKVYPEGYVFTCMYCKEEIITKDKYTAVNAICDECLFK